MGEITHVTKGIPIEGNGIPCGPPTIPLVLDKCLVGIRNHGRLGRDDGRGKRHLPRHDQTCSVMAVIPFATNGMTELATRIPVAINQITDETNEISVMRAVRNRLMPMALTCLIWNYG